MMRGLDSQERRVLEVILEPTIMGLFHVVFHEAAVIRLIAQRRLVCGPCANCGQSHQLTVTPDGKTALEIIHMLESASAASAGW